MAAAIEAPSTAQTPPPEIEDVDVLQRHLKRTLPCELSRSEQTDIAIDAAKKRRRVRELEDDLAKEKKRRQQQIDELQAEIDTHDRELDTGEQERVVLCDLIFRRGTVFVRRNDTKDLIEPRPATPSEAQRFLPAIEHMVSGTTGARPSLLEQAAAAQGRGAAGEDDGVPDGEDDGVPDGEDDGVPDGDDEPEDDGLSDPPAKTPRRSRKGKS